MLFLFLLEKSMADKKIHHLTKAGYEKMQEELRTLKEEKLPAILEKLKAAIEQWDLSENAEYEQAMEEKAMTESRIAELEDFLKHVEIIEWWDIDTVWYWNKVTILRDWKEETYEIVGSWEVDIFENKISLDSPIGSAIKGKRVWDKVIADTPKWEYEVEILKIE